MAVGISDALADPTLELHLPDGTTMTNDDWKKSQEGEIAATGLQPKSDHEAALIATLGSGAYTAIVGGKNGGTGTGLVEAYDLGAAANSRLANISTRGLVGAGDAVLIGGFIAGSSVQVVARAIGPSLTDAGVAGVLQDPELEIRNPDGSLMASNDDWRGAQESEIEHSGFAPGDDREAVIIATLPANGYTVIVHGKGGTTGVGLVEVYGVD